MLVQDRFALRDPGHARRVVREHPWAMLITCGSGGLRATHLPCLLDPRDDGSGWDDFVILGHVARADPQAVDLRRSHDAVVVFQGPNGYMPAAWHATPGRTVGTWNYQAVHMHGTPRVIEDTHGALDVLRRTFEHLESRRPHSQPWNQIAELADRIVAGTCCFRLKAARVEAKAKLSQDKSPQVRQRLIDALEAPGPYQRPALADAMRP